MATTTRKHIVDISGKLPTILCELDASDDSLAISYIYADAQILAQYTHNDDADETINERFYYVHDRLGSVRLMVDYNDTTDVAGAVNTYTYNPFGDHYTPDTVDPTYNPWQFTGQYNDTEINQYYLRARQYDPTMMRFTTRDPVRGKLQKPLSLHKYLYCQNDGVNHVDPSGKILGFANLLISRSIEANLRKADYKFHKKIYDKCEGNLDAFSLMNLQRGAAYDLLIADYDVGLKSTLRDGGIEALGLFSENLGRIASLGAEIYDDRKIIIGILENESWSGAFDYGKDKLTDIFLDPETYY